MKSQPVPTHEMSHPPGRLTSLSRPASVRHRKFRHLSYVAWASLCVVAIAVLGGPSCLLTSNPDFTKPQRTPPFLTNITPAPYQIIPVNTLAQQPQTFTFEVVSEDLQSSDLQAVLILDFHGFSSPDVPARPWGTANIPAGHLNTPARDSVKAEFTFSASTPRGCHSATLVVTHAFVDILAPKL